LNQYFPKSFSLAQDDKQKQNAPGGLAGAFCFGGSINEKPVAKATIIASLHSGA
jgi:hypothetical protein